MEISNINGFLFFAQFYSLHPKKWGALYKSFCNFSKFRINLYLTWRLLFDSYLVERSRVLLFDCFLNMFPIMKIDYKVKKILISKM